MDLPTHKIIMKLFVSELTANLLTD